jgi:hypothetical protein
MDHMLVLGEFERNGDFLLGFWKRYELVIRVLGSHHATSLIAARI